MNFRLGHFFNSYVANYQSQRVLISINPINPIATLALVFHISHHDISHYQPEGHLLLWKMDEDDPVGETP